jgi:hypothetical protein
VIESNSEPADLLLPEEIAGRLGISVKSLAALIRERGLEVTPMGYAPASIRGGRRRRLWGMTELQFEALIAARKRPGVEVSGSGGRPPGTSPSAT